MYHKICRSSLIHDIAKTIKSFVKTYVKKNPLSLSFYHLFVVNELNQAKKEITWFSEEVRRLQESCQFDEI